MLKSNKNIYRVSALLFVGAATAMVFSREGLKAVAVARWGKKYPWLNGQDFAYTDAYGYPAVKKGYTSKDWDLLRYKELISFAFWNPSDFISINDWNDIIKTKIDAGHLL